MQRPMRLFTTALVVGAATAHSVVTHADAPINPPLKDVASDKKFFGPGGDYPNDERPAIKKGVLNKLKSADQPYPALQSKSDFDKDFIKDENSDRGSWKAQFEYDALRKKMAKEEADAKAAEGKAAKEGADVDAAQKKVDDADKKVKGAQGDADAAKKEGEHAGDDVKDKDTGAADGADGAATKEALEKLKKKVADAEAAYEKQKESFAQCKKELEDAKKELEELKAAQAEMEQKLEGDTKLWIEAKKGRETVRMNLKKAKQEVSSAKREAAQAHLKVALNNKADMDRVLAVKKAASDKANAALAKQKAELEQARKDMEKATLTLQKLRGYTPKDSLKKAAAPSMTSWLWSLFK